MWYRAPYGNDPLLHLFSSQFGSQGSIQAHFGLRWIHRRAEDFFTQQTTDKKGLVSDRLGRKTHTLSPPEPSVGRILFVAGIRADRALTIGLRGDHQPEHVFDIPVTVHELDSQPVQQLWVGRKIPLRPKLLAGKHQLPDQKQPPTNDSP